MSDCSQKIIWSTFSDHQGDVIVYADISGSMNYDRWGKRTRESGSSWANENLTDLLSEIGPYVLQPYGNKNRVPTLMINDPSQLPLNYGGYTYPRNFISPMESGTIPPETIVIIGDGAFTGQGNKTGTQSFSLCLEKLARNGFLRNLKNFFVFFTPNTQTRDERSLRDALDRFCTVQEGIAISPDFVKCSSRRRELVTTLKEFTAKTTLVVPPGWFSVFGLFSFSPDILISELAQLLKTNSEIDEKILDKMKYFVENRPEVLLTGVYFKIHSLLHILFRESGYYKKYMGEQIKNAGPEKKKILQELIDSSFQDEDERRNLMKDTIPFQTGEFISFVNPEGIGEAIRAKVTLVGLISDFISSGRPADKGFPILNQEAPQELLELCFRTIFSPYQISDILKVIVIMSIMTSKAQIPESFLEMTKRTAFGMSNTIRKMLFSENVDPLFYAARVCITVGKFLSFFRKEIFPNPSEEEKKAIHHFLVATRVYKAFGAVNSVAGNFSIIRKVPKETRIPKKNDIVLLPPFEKDPQPKLPSLARILSVKEKKGSFWIRVEYLDRQLGTNDVHIYKIEDISQTGFEFLGYECSEDLIFTLNRFVMRMSSKPELQGIERDKTKLSAALEDFKILLPEIPPPELVDKFVPVPRELIVNNLVTLPILRKLLIHKQNPNMNNIIAAMNETEEEFECSKNFKLNGVIYTLSDEDIARLKTEFKTKILLANPEFCLTVLEMDDCPICYEECVQKDMVREICGHSFCNDCNQHLQPNYSEGIVNLVEHLCPCCRQFIRPDNEDVKNWYEGGQNGHPRFCTKCHDFFLQEPPACGGGDEALIMTCEKCTVSKFRGCPGCGVTIEHDGACDHMECTKCGTHFCMFCGYSAAKSKPVYDHMWAEHGGIFTVQNLE